MTYQDMIINSRQKGQKKKEVIRTGSYGDGPHDILAHAWTPACTLVLVWNQDPDRLRGKK